jgi:DNA-binding response OmpR family regulator
MKSLKILVIEGDIFFSGILARFIQQTDADMIVESSTGTLEDLFVCQPDVLLLDLDIPGLKNLNKISQARKVLPQALIIVMGMIDDVSYRALALAYGADDFLGKDDLSNKLFPALTYHLSLNIPV